MGTGVLVVAWRRAALDGYTLIEGSCFATAPAGTTARLACETLRDEILGLIAVCSMTLLIFITLQVALVAQAPGIAHMTRSLIWMVLLLFMVFPWQIFFSRDFHIPGLLYGYRELLEMIGPFVAKNNAEQLYRLQGFMVIARFIFWPVIGMIVMLISAERFRAGIMLAIGHPLQSMMQPRPKPMAAPAGTPAKR